MAFQMSSGSDRDGLGYSALNEAGDLFGERWLNNDDAFVRRAIKSDKCKEIEQELAGLLSENQVGETYGEFGIGVGGLDSISAITLHTRLATSGKGFANCHPFVSEDGLTSLIHNGVITNQWMICINQH